MGYGIWKVFKLISIVYILDMRIIDAFKWKREDSRPFKDHAVKVVADLKLLETSRQIFGQYLNIKDPFFARLEFFYYNRQRERKIK